MAGEANLSAKVLARIEQAIKQGETTHSGQVRFVVEGALDGAPLFRNQAARERALDVFSHLRIWDTAHNNGVLIYLLLADRDVESLPTAAFTRRSVRGLGEHLPRDGGRVRLRRVRARRDRRHRGGVARAVRDISRRKARIANELPDAPVVM